MTLAEYALALSFLVTSAQGQKFTEGISLDGALAIADGCAHLPVFGQAARCVVLLIVMAARESGFNPLAVGDSGYAKGAFQSHYCAHCKTWDEEVANILPIYKTSAARCDEPLALAARGTCKNEEGRAISRHRMKEVKRLYALLPLPEEWILLL